VVLFSEAGLGGSRQIFFRKSYSNGKFIADAEIDDLRLKWRLIIKIPHPPLMTSGFFFKREQDGANRSGVPCRSLRTRFTKRGQWFAAKFLSNAGSGQCLIDEQIDQILRDCSHSSSATQRRKVQFSAALTLLPRLRVDSIRCVDPSDARMITCDKPSHRQSV